MIPSWKVKRELNRLGQQLKSTPEFFWEPIAIRVHDAAFEKGFPIFDGQVPALPKIAIVLCFQPKGLAKSFFVTLAHLVKNGYAPLVISNSKLSDVDKMKLKPTAWRVVERPNFGYDFGGYRDGIFLLRKWNISPDRLVIMNDSIWYPLWENDTTLQKAEASEFDVVGIVMREKGDTRYLESYFFSLKGNMLENHYFKEFWTRIRLTSNKFKVVRRGERDFGKHMMRTGIKFGPIFRQDELKICIKNSSPDDLKNAIFYHRRKSSIDKDIFDEIGSTDTDQPLTNIIEFINDALDRKAFSEDFQIIAAKKIGFSVLKKRGATLAVWRREWLRAVENKFLPQPFSEVLEEVSSIVESEEYIIIN